MVRFPTKYNPFGLGLIEQAFEFKDGYIHPTGAPGLGIDLPDKPDRAVPVHPEQRHLPRPGRHFRGRLRRTGVRQSRIRCRGEARRETRMTATTKLLVTVPELEGREELLAEIAAVSPRLEIAQRACRSAGEVTAALGDAEIIYTLWFPETIAPDSQLRWLQMTSTGVDNKLSNTVFDPRNAVVVTSAGRLPRRPHRRITASSRWACWHAGYWASIAISSRKCRDRAHSTLTDLWGQTVGIVGYGPHRPGSSASRQELQHARAGPEAQPGTAAGRGL